MIYFLPNIKIVLNNILKSTLGAEIINSFNSLHFLSETILVILGIDRKEISS